MSAEDRPDLHDSATWWRHRRWQAYIALSGVMVLGMLSALGFVVEGSAPVVQSAIWALTAIVAVYSGGASVVDSISKVRKK